MSLLGSLRDRPGRRLTVPAATSTRRQVAQVTRPTEAKTSGRPHSARRYVVQLWTVLAACCLFAMMVAPSVQTIPYHLGWAGFFLAFGLSTWSNWQLLIGLSWYTVSTGVLFERGWALGRIGWDETTEVPLMFLLAMLMVWHARRRQAALAHVTRLAQVDGLTDLANRSSFNSALSAALEDRRSDSTTVLFVDLDDFKDVNDMFGHGAGDELLQEVAARLCNATRPGDLCARLGGDEFAVLLRDTGSDEGADVARRIVAAVGVTVRIGNGSARVGASVGVATAAGDNDLELLIHRADVAMYAAKAAGKGRVQVFLPGLLEVDSSQTTFDRQLASAADSGELIVHYQPVLSLPDGRCTAVEALVRWEHPERGLLYPDSFIGAAERIGAIRDIGTYVLRRACADAALWRKAHPTSPLAVHVNLSALQLDDEGFVEVVTGCLRDFTMAPDQLVLEVTETVVISSPVAMERLNALAAHGVRIAIDDFGTGYSALTTLRSLPAQIVKIDKSFVAGCTENPPDRAVIEAVVNMAAQMGMQTIAEGVERPEQQGFLEGIGTDAVQGYLHLRPTSAHEFGIWLGGHLAGLSPSPLSPPPETDNVVIPISSRQIARGQGRPRQIS